MMQVWAASEAAPGQLENEDLVLQYGPVVGVLDGATVPDGFETGCVHGPAWYVRWLAARIALAVAGRPDDTLVSHLAAAILAVRADHGGQCDLDHPGTPSSTVSLLRYADDHVDYLVLCDSPLVIDCGDQVRVISDDRLARSAAELRRTAQSTSRPSRPSRVGTPSAVGAVSGSADPAAAFRQAVAMQRQWMNQTHGYWVAAANPDAAHHSVTGTLPLTGPVRVRRAALLTDGASSAVDLFGLFSWRDLLNMIADQGPAELIRLVRLAERAARIGEMAGAGEGPARRKRHDDATAVLCRFDRE